MPHVIIATDSGSAGNVPNYDLDQPLGFLVDGGEIQAYSDQTQPPADTSALKTMVTVPQNAGTVTNFEISLRNVWNYAITDVTVTVDIWEYTMSISGSVGTYTSPLSPLATIALTIPSGLTPLIYGTVTMSHTFGAASAASVSLSVTDTSSSDGTVYIAQYLAILS